MFPASENGPSVYTPLVSQTHPLLPVEEALLSVLPSTPEHRRKPLLAVLNLLQRRYNLHGTEGNEEFSGHMNSSDTSSTDTRSKDSEENKGNSTTTDNLQTESLIKTHQVGRIYALLDTLMREHPDTNDGFSYAFKYQVPPASSKLDNVEVSVQQSLKRYPQVGEYPLHNRVLNAPLDYRRVQDKLDAVLEDSVKTGGPVHLNTPGVFGPLLLSQYSVQNQGEGPEQERQESERIEEERALKPTKLILRPAAKAVAGPRGIAVASPIARAVLRRGQPVSVEYEPDAVAIAGPGGRAHSHPEFSVDYIESEESRQ